MLFTLYALHTGSMGGVVEACFCQPIDVIKTRLQLDHVNRYSGELPIAWHR